MNLVKKEPIFKNKTTYNSKLYNKFIQFHNNKFGNKYMFFTILVCLFFIYCIIANLIVKNILISLLLLLVTVLFLYIRIYKPISDYKKTCKTFSKSEEMNFTFIFYKYYFKIIDNENVKNSAKIYYIKLRRVIVDKNFFYLYINDDTAALVSKTGFVLGREKDFNDFIRKKCFLKYSKM